MVSIEGIIPVVLTPFNKAQELDENALRVMVKRFIEKGVHGLFCLGTNGEFFSMTTDEKIKVISIVVDEAKGKLPIYAGSGGISTKEVIYLSQTFEKMGVDVLSIITPYFLPFTQDELIQHYTMVAKSTSLPILLYNIPSKTGLSLEPSTVKELAKLPNIVGIKDSSGDFNLMQKYIDVTSSEFACLAGSDALILQTLMAGGKGGVSGTSNVLTDEMLALYHNWQNGNIDEATRIQQSLQPLIDIYSSHTLPSVIKEACNMIGIPAGMSRLPVSPLSKETRDKLQKVLIHYKKL